MLAVLSGLGTTVIIVALAIKGAISIVAAILLCVIATPAVGTLMFWLAMLIAMPLMGVAKLLDQEVTNALIEQMPEEYV